MSLPSGPLISTGLLLAFAGLILVLGLALQAWADRRRRGNRSSRDLPANVDGSNQDIARRQAPEEPVTNDEMPEDRRGVDEFDAAQIEAVEPKIPTSGEPVTYDQLPEDRRWVEELADRIEVVDAKLALAHESVERTLRLLEEPATVDRWNQDIARIPTAEEPGTYDQLPEDRLWAEEFAEQGDVVEMEIARADDMAVHTLRLVDADGEAPPGQTDSEPSSHDLGADTVPADPDRGAREAI